MKSVAAKMGLKPGMRSHFVSAPNEALADIGLPPLRTVDHLDGLFDYIHLFAIDQLLLDKSLPILRPHLDQYGKLWVSWPKGGKLGTNLNIREVIRIGYNHNLVESTCLSIDSTWSALKFTHPVPGRRYNNSYGTLPKV